MRINRIVQRQSLKEQVATFRARIEASRPLMEAERRLQQAYQAGFIKGMQEAKASLDQPLQERPDTADNSSPTDPQEQTPVGAVSANGG